MKFSIIFLFSICSTAMAAETYHCDQTDLITGATVMTEASYSVYLDEREKGEVWFNTFAPHSGPGLAGTLKSDFAHKDIYLTSEHIVPQESFDFTRSSNRKAGVLTIYASGRSGERSTRVICTL